MARQGSDRPRSPAGAAGATPRRAAAQPNTRERVSPVQYLAEVRSEMRKVAWPTRSEIIQSSIVVLIAVTFMTTLIFGFDWASSHFVTFLFG
jgi:preprotein translocase subunit SecE